MVTQVKHYINGKQVSGRNGRTSSVFNPAKGEQTGSVSIANAADVADAVAAATRAAPGWAATTALRRARILNRFLRILEERIDELADVIVAEHWRIIRTPSVKFSVAWKSWNSRPPPRSC